MVLVDHILEVDFSMRGDRDVLGAGVEKGSGCQQGGMRRCGRWMISHAGVLSGSPLYGLPWPGLACIRYQLPPNQ